MVYWRSNGKEKKLKVIDVSKYQNKIDWEKVKADKVDGVIIRAGFGAGNIDPMFYDHIEGALSVGLLVGVYWFSYAYNAKMAKQEAIYCHASIERFKNKLSLPVFFDWEYDSFEFAKKLGVIPNKDLITEMNLAFCSMMESIGYTAGYYLNYDYSKQYVDESRLKKYKRWFARYTANQQTDCYMWQFTSKGKVDGIKGNVDCNVLYENITSTLPKEDPQEPQATDEPGEDYNMTTIRNGDKGKAVKIWQVIVNTKADGVFGKKTEEATKTFQKEKGLKADGIVGKETWKAGLESV